MDAALTLSSRHEFDCSTMPCLALPGVVAGKSVNRRRMRAVSSEALAVAADHCSKRTTWSGTATAMPAGCQNSGLGR